MQDRRLILMRQMGLCAVVLVFCLLGFRGADASTLFQLEPVEMFAGENAGKWKRVERLRDHHSAFRQEQFSPDGKHIDPWLVKWFGSDTPHSGEFLLHCILPSPSSSRVSKLTPVLLVNGAADTANRTWIHPWDLSLPQSLPVNRQGFALGLASAGVPVCAISFALSQSDNFMQAEQVANAIRRMRVLLGREGDDHRITYQDSGQVMPMPWGDIAPPGDGVVFLASSQYTKNILKRGAPLIAQYTVHFNHVELARKPAVLALIKDILKKGSVE